MLVGTMNNPHKDLVGEIGRAGELSFDFFEITCEAPFAPPSILHMKRRQILQAIASYNMGVLGHLPWYLHIAFPYESVERACLAEFECAIDALCGLGAKKITIHTEFLPKFYATRKELVEATVRNLGSLKDYAARHGARLLVENYMDFSFTAQEFAGLVKKQNIGMTFDAGHEFANSKGSNKAIIGFAKKFSKCISHTHFSDNAGDRDAHLAIGDGKIDWAGTISCLKKFYNGTITLEVHKQAASGKTEADATDRALFESKKKIEQLWYGKNQVKEDYAYVYPKGHKFK
ncbi:sugar phosphate isomerase/epimerase [Candidatus Parvarchaeota archaeon]|nr:sugar phosphate isomerase/epimerase [Candidatus Parvarchaeota archaeon]